VIPIKFNQSFLDKHIVEVSKSLQKRIQKALDSKLSSNEKKSIEYIEQHLEDILKADNNELQTIIQYFYQHYPNAIGVVGQKKEDWNSLYKIVRDIFEKEYNYWSQKTDYNAYYFVEQLGIKTCPYCNRNYTFVVDNENGKLRPEIDHFYPKSIYPFLAMSFYNLIPSCPICNHTKKDRDSYKEKLINPYEYKENDFKFTYIPSEVEFNEIEKQKYNYDSFEIEFESGNKNIDTFKLEELYKQHKDIVVELLVKKAYYPQSYIEELASFGFGEDEVYRYLLGNYKKDEDLHKRPLSKLIKDISQELKLI